MKRTSWLVLGSGLLVSTGCDPMPVEPVDPTPGKGTMSSSAESEPVTIGDVKRDAATAAKTTAAYSQQNKDKVMKDLKAQLATLDASIESLRKRGETLADDAKKSWDTRMVELDAKRKTANAKLLEMEDSTAQAWADVEKGAQSAWDELKIAVQNASKEF
jgi:hypothetical protein